jgi:hypothetical protein
MTLATFFISFTKPPDEDVEAEYRIDPDAYVEALQKRWQYGNIGRRSGIYSVHWELDKETELGAPGGLFSDGRTVHSEAIRSRMQLILCCGIGSLYRKSIPYSCLIRVWKRFLS